VPNLGTSICPYHIHNWLTCQRAQVRIAPPVTPRDRQLHAALIQSHNLLAQYTVSASSSNCDVPDIPGFTTRQMTDLMSVTSMKDTTPLSSNLQDTKTQRRASAEDLFRIVRLGHSSWMYVAVVLYDRTDRGSTVKNPSNYATRFYQYNFVTRSLRTNRKRDSSRAVGIH
jgi:hypothetical protein